MKIEIRKAKKEDFEDYYKLWCYMEENHQKRWKGIKKERFQLNKGALKEKIKLMFLKFLRNKKMRTYFAYDEDKKVGFITVKIQELNLKYSHYKLNRWGVICDLVVAKNYQGKNIASKLKDESYTWLKENKIKFVSIGQDYLNEKAMKIYKHWGFVPDYLMSISKLK
jgi:GNAT superfamily N-acetyltransferase